MLLDRGTVILDGDLSNLLMSLAQFALNHMMQRCTVIMMERGVPMGMFLSRLRLRLEHATTYLILKTATI